MELNDLNSAEYNPRKITDEKKIELKKSLLRFGDLSGVVFNNASGNLVGGHQRVSVFKDNNPKIIMDDVYETSTEKGTVARGHFVIEGEKYSYREVHWEDENFEKEANIKANLLTGDWDYDLLKEITERDNLIAWGFEADSLDYEFKDEDFGDFNLEDKDKSKVEELEDSEDKMTTIELEFMPEDYTLFTQIMAEIKIEYGTPVEKTRLGLKLGKLLRKIKDENITC